MIDSISNQDFFNKEHNSDITVIDVRESFEFNAGHIPGATNFPLTTLANDFSKLNKNTHYYVICRSGNRSATACNFLGSKGFNVTNVEGGMIAWKGEVA
ncbi:rhodanese-like domain-containing protein [Lentilactobacillus sp. Marseille-Q4993]|uniref:rhodanese-like domain-containing protein n=1 Tax=Lentilactobacillus sp. Marseille-Q4993 TaxID=3039492 RepID=UPI0024BC5BD2|nr:rhodanese-like domain-containing protein [Lentilactobacillus sp. Marseille-Q4993]